jgi:hypothetical protein
MRISAIISIVLATSFASFGSAWAYEPISPDEAAQLPGKTVYAAANEQIFNPSARWTIFAGTAFTVSSVAQAGTNAAFWSVLGTTRDGRAVRLPLYRVSTSSPTFDLNAPGSASALFANVLSEAEPLASRVISIREKYKHGNVNDVADAAIVFALDSGLFASPPSLRSEVVPSGPCRRLHPRPRTTWCCCPVTESGSR